jgi:Cu(I)/Ag(I) efflux system membrane fusion protein
MKKFRLVILVSAMMFFVAACNSNTSRSGNQKGTESTEQPIAEGNYTCPMHPEVTSDHPGECPKCGMALVEVDSANVSGSDSLSL